MTPLVGGPIELALKEQYINQGKSLSNQDIATILQTKRLQGNETPQEIFSTLSDIIYRIYANVKKTPNYNAENMWKLSTRQLLTKKEVFFMNTCLEYTMLTLQYMKSAGFESTYFVINELSTQHPGLYKIHFGVEGILNNNNYYVDHKRRNSVHIGKGKFVSNYKDINEEVVNTIYIPGNNIGIDDSFPDLYNKGIINFKYFSPELLECFKKKFQQDNTPNEWQNGFVAKVGHPEKPEIFIEK